MKNNQTKQTLSPLFLMRENSMYGRVVKVSPSDATESFYGIVVEDNPNFYAIIPCSNPQITQNWNKSCCSRVSYQDSIQALPQKSK